MAFSVPRARVSTANPASPIGQGLQALGQGIAQAGQSLGQIAARREAEKQAIVDREAQRRIIAASSDYQTAVSAVVDKYRADPNSTPDKFQEEATALQEQYSKASGLSGEYLANLQTQMHTISNSSYALVHKHVQAREEAKQQRKTQALVEDSVRTAGEGWAYLNSAGGWDTWTGNFGPTVAQNTMATMRGEAPETIGVAVANNMRVSAGRAVSNMVNSLEIGPTMDINYAAYKELIAEAPGLDDTFKKQQTDRLDLIYKRNLKEIGERQKEANNQFFVDLGKQMAGTNEFERASVIDRAIQANPAAEPEIRKFGRKWEVETQPGARAALMAVASSPDLNTRQRLQAINDIRSKFTISGKDWASAQAKVEGLKDDRSRQVLKEFYTKIEALSQVSGAPRVVLEGNDPFTFTVDKTLADAIKGKKDQLMLIGADYLALNPDADADVMVEKFKKEFIQLEGAQARGTVADKMSRYLSELERQRMHETAKKRSKNPLLQRESIRTIQQRTGK